MMAATLDNTDSFLQASLEFELASLFGRATVRQAKQTDVVDLDLDAEFLDGIAEMAGQLIQATGKPTQQREFVARLNAENRLMLCMWLLDSGLASKLIGEITKRNGFVNDKGEKWP